MTLAPRVEIYTNLACEAYLPDHAHHTHHPSNPNGTYVEVRPLPPPSIYSTSLTSTQDIFAPFTWSTLSKGVKHHELPDDEDETIGELPKQRCFKDPVVQQAAAKLQMAVILTMGILSAATTGWWGSVGDRIGRTKVLALSLTGYLFTSVFRDNIGQRQEANGTGNQRLHVHCDGHVRESLGAVGRSPTTHPWSRCRRSTRRLVSTYRRIHRRRLLIVWHHNLIGQQRPQPSTHTSRISHLTARALIVSAPSRAYYSLVSRADPLSGA